MGTVNLAVYKGKGKLFNKFVRWWTGSDYSHCELVVGAFCYSSSAMDGGVRVKQIDLEDGKWDLVEIPWVQDSQIKDYFQKTKKHKYGYFGLVVSQIFNSGRGQKDAPFCSEWCASALGLPNASIYSPDRLLNLISYLTEHRIK